MSKNINRNQSSDAWIKWPCWNEEGKRCWCTKTTRTCTNKLRGNYIRDFSGGSEQEKYSNFTKGYGQAIFTMYAGAAFGVLSLYKLGQGEKKYIQLFVGFALGLYAPTLIQKAHRYKKKGKKA